jgi:hypothetical protein
MPGLLKDWNCAVEAGAYSRIRRPRARVRNVLAVIDALDEILRLAGFPNPI